ncbi:MAG: hypothetical protein KQH53_07980 [Desulfarculaceae bacterium]|nr:hypothetical protein [Desulfarculaceae bacterium]
MTKRLAIWGAALLLVGLLTSPAALADETGCAAKVTMLGGEVMRVKNFGARLLQADFLATEVVVQMDEGQATIDLRDLKSMTRLDPPTKASSGQLVTFAYVAKDGTKGTFKIDGGYYLSGQFSLGDWTVTAGEVKQVVLDCAPLN